VARNSKSSATGDKAKAIVVAFGRFQPPTSGHQLLVDKVISYAKSMGVDYAMFSSRTHDKKRNPLPAHRKFHYLKKFFPDGNFIDSEKIKTPVDMLAYLAEMGYRKVWLVSGEDRFAEYKKFRRFLDPKATTHIPLQSIDFLEAGKRDPDAEGVQGMSGSKLRKAVADGEFDKFAGAMPRRANTRDVRALFDELAAALVVKEGADYSNIYRCAAIRLLESDKYKRRPPTPGQTGGFSKHNKRFPTPPCKIDEDLGRWFREKWVDISRKGKDGGYAPCGRADASKGAYPKCRPLHKVSSKTPETVGEMGKSERKAAVRQKRRIQGGNPQGTGNTPKRATHANIKKSK
jgi:hypothetical protein